MSYPGRVVPQGRFVPLIVGRGPKTPKSMPKPAPWVASVCYWHHHCSMNDLDHLCDLAELHANEASGTAIPGFRIRTLPARSPPAPMLYEPMVCLVLSGVKRLYAGKAIIDYGEGQHLISTADMPVMAEVLGGGRRGRYLALVLRLDPNIVADFAGKFRHVRLEPACTNFAITPSDALLFDAWRRMCQLLERPDEIPVLAPLIEREIIFRLFQGPQADVLAQVCTADYRVRHIRTTAAWLRANYKQQVSIDGLAEMANMSVTSFHRSFKEVMSMSPLQYQKTVRLYEARKRLAATPRDSASVAYAVGYESPSQFSREYKRLFGASPSQDLNFRRNTKE